MSKSCIAFKMNNEDEALEHMNTDHELVKKYGDYSYGHFMSQGDDGWRAVIKCNTCGGLYLVQKSEVHFMTHGDEWWTDYFPVSSIEEADEICQTLDGDRITELFQDRYLRTRFSGTPRWKLPSNLPDEKKEEIKSKYNCTYADYWW